MSVLTEIEKPTVNIAEAALNAVVKGKESNGESWKEVSDVTSYSATGAGFYLTRECKAGRLISLMLPLPAYMRCYDHQKELYRVWGLIQHCQQTHENSKEKYHVGVAFIGKNPPSAYNADPSQRYRICGMNEDGLWKIEPAAGEFKVRKDIRYWTPFELYLSLIDAERHSLKGARALTENISKGGAAVISDLDVNVGDRVKFIVADLDFSGLAVVCNRQDGEDKKTRLHLNFIEPNFPVEKLKAQTQK
jgi:hypothetical protein